MHLTDIELQVLAHLSTTPEWKKAEVLLRRLQQEASDQLVKGVDLHFIHRAQGRHLALGEFADMVSTAGSLLEQQRARRGISHPGLSAHQ
jgi:hypothetical protein